MDLLYAGESEVWVAASESHLFRLVVLTVSVFCVCVQKELSLVTSNYM